MKIAVDALIFFNDKLLVVKRNTEPFFGKYALPGGFVKERELLKDAIVREVKEETNLDVKPIAMLGIYDQPDRDPRERVISVVYICALNPGKMQLKSDKNENSEVKFIEISDVVNDKITLAFDHSKMVKSYINILQLGKK